MKKAGVKILWREEQQIEGELVLKEGKVYVLKDEKLRVEIIQLYHDTLVAQYGRKWKMTELVTRNYWQLGVINNVKRYVSENEEWNRSASRKVKVEQDSRKTVDISNGGLYYKVTGSS